MVRIEPAPSCLLGLHWELSFTQLQTDDVVRAIVAMGYSDKTRMPAVRTFASSTGERLIVIPKTGRVQLRLDFETPKSERSSRAVVIAKWIVASAASSL